MLKSQLVKEELAGDAQDCVSPLDSMHALPTCPQQRQLAFEVTHQ